MGQDPLRPQWTLLDVERSIPEWGNCRIDLAFDTPLGVVIWDWKTKLTSDPKWLPRDVERWRLSEQRWHYPAAYANITGQPVVAFYIGLVVFEPFRVHVLPFVNNPEDLLLWQAGRERTWATMTAEISLGWPAAVHETVYGPCEFVEACFDAHLDPDLMTQAYHRKERNP